MAPGYIIIWLPPASCGRHICTQFNLSTVKVIPWYLRPDAPVLYTGASLYWQLSRGSICYRGSIYNDMFKCSLEDYVSNENNTYVGLTTTTLSRRLTVQLNESSSIALHLRSHSSSNPSLKKLLLKIPL